MDMVEDLLEYCHRIEKVLEKRGIRARTVRESFEFERGKDPKKALDVGPNRRIRKGDRVEVEYKGEKFTVTAIEDEEEPKKDKVMVRSGDDWRPPEYETRTIREFWFKDDEDGICFAEAREWWDNQGNTIWPWIVPEYGKTGMGEPVLESVEFERGKDPKKAMDIGINRKIKKGDFLYIWIHEFGETVGATALEDENQIGHVEAELSRGGHWVKAFRNFDSWEAYL